MAAERPLDLVHVAQDGAGEFGKRDAVAAVAGCRR